MRHGTRSSRFSIGRRRKMSQVKCRRGRPRSAPQPPHQKARRSGDEDPALAFWFLGNPGRQLDWVTDRVAQLVNAFDTAHAVLKNLDESIPVEIPGVWSALEYDQAN